MLRAVRKRNAANGQDCGAAAEAWLRRPICWTRTGIVSFYNYPKAVATPADHDQWNPRSPDFGCAPMRPRFKKVNSRPAMLEMVLVAEKRFRRLKAPELMRDVYQGAKYVNGVLVNEESKEKAA